MVTDRQFDAPRRRPDTPKMSWVLRGVGALLALEISWVHVVDQGGFLQLRDPPFIGWGYRMVELAGVVVALCLLGQGRNRLSWLGAAGIAAVPLIGYFASGGTGLPDSYPDEVGRWLQPLGIIALTVELGLLMLAVRMLIRLSHRGELALREDREE